MIVANDNMRRPRRFAIRHGVRLCGRELQLFRIFWRRPGYQVKLSAKILLEPRDLWVGAYWTTDERWKTSRIVFVCIVPCLPLRLHYKRSAGGNYPELAR